MRAGANFGNMSNDNGFSSRFLRLVLRDQPCGADLSFRDVNGVSRLGHANAQQDVRHRGKVAWKPLFPFSRLLQDRGDCLQPRAILCTEDHCLAPLRFTWSVLSRKSESPFRCEDVGRR